jgi:PAS domain-containing protein
MSILRSASDAGEPGERCTVYRLVNMTQKLIPSDEVATALSYQRQTLLKHVATVLSTVDARVTEQVSEREAQLSAITASSLEELKVAEEELTERTLALADLRDQLEQRLNAATQLFELAPPCLLVTDVYGTILQANRAMRGLLRLEASALHRQPLARFIPLDARRGFRDGLSRIAGMDGVSDWRMLIVRQTDAPVEVSAVVQVVRGADTPSGTALYWAFTPLADIESTRAHNE